MWRHVIEGPIHVETYLIGGPIHVETCLIGGPHTCGDMSYRRASYMWRHVL
jgi:hypothetical protein